MTVTEDQAPSFNAKQTVYPKACPRPGCGGDIGRFQELEGYTLKCMMCNREVSDDVLR